MKIICTEYEKAWMEDLLLNSYFCGIECSYKSDYCNTPCSRRCREEHIEFEIKKEKEGKYV